MVCRCDVSVAHKKVVARVVVCAGVACWRVERAPAHGESAVLRRQRTARRGATRAGRDRRAQWQAAAAGRARAAAQQRLGALHAPVACGDRAAVIVAATHNTAGVDTVRGCEFLLLWPRHVDGRVLRVAERHGRNRCFAIGVHHVVGGGACCHTFSGFVVVSSGQEAVASGDGVDM
jgi:hypothetical protein